MLGLKMGLQEVVEQQQASYVHTWAAGASGCRVTGFGWSGDVNAQLELL